MFTAIATAARVLGAHAPALLAWMIAGTLGHYLVLELASLVGARTAIGGILLLPVAALCLLVAYVAMFLVLRGSMPQLRELAPLPESAAERRRAFLDALLGGMLPFLAFYAAWGYIREDVITYVNGAFDWHYIWGIEAAVAGQDFDSSGTISDLGWNPLTLIIVAAAFAGRRAYKKYKERIPGWTAGVAVYLEALWIYLAAYLVSDLFGFFGEWVATRQGTVWLADLRGMLTGVFAPLGFLWDGVLWLLAEAGGVILLPVAWLTIAGVIYGQAVKAEAPVLSGALVERARTRYGTVPERIRRRLGDIWNDFAGRFRPVGRALALMWWAGPVLVGGYILFYTLLDFGEQRALIGLSRAIGPHLSSFWVPVSAALVLVVTVLIEPVRIAVVAGAYDGVLGRLRGASPTKGADAASDTAVSAVEGETQVDGAVAAVIADRADGGLDDEIAGGIVGEQDGEGHVERLR